MDAPVAAEGNSWPHRRDRGRLHPSVPGDQSPQCRRGTWARVEANERAEEPVKRWEAD